MSRISRSIVEPSDGFGSDGVAPAARDRTIYTEHSQINNEESDHRSPHGATEDGDGADGIQQTPLCYCGQHSIKLISRSNLNPNRPFFKCHKFKDDPTQCKFFQWEDKTPINTARSPSRPPPATRPRYDRPSISFDPPNSFRQRNASFTPSMDPPRGDSYQPQGKSGACLRCGEEGHWAAECPTGRKSAYNNDGWCSTGGDGAANKPLFGAGNGGRECFHCGDPGHWVKDCPLKNGENTNNNSSGGGGGGGGYNSSQYVRHGGGGGCYKCGGQDHWVRDCPMNNTTNNNSNGYNNAGGRYAGSKRSYYENFL